MFSQLSRSGRFANMNLKEGTRRHEEIHRGFTVRVVKVGRHDCFTPVKLNDLSKKKRKAVLPLLVIIREMRCGKIKGRVVADGSKQQGVVPKENAALPNIQLESLTMPLLC